LCGFGAAQPQCGLKFRSLVVNDAVGSRGIGRQLVDELASRAAASGFETLCAFTHVAGYLSVMGFSIVPHTAAGKD
jgi:N-acetylglutamate synthase-like GNAT family acetyltransferase